MAENNQEVDGRVKRMCQPCLCKDIKRSAEVFCATCNEFQCNDCTNGHMIYAFMKDHKLLSVKEDLSQVGTNDVDMNGIDICKKHKKPFEFYCEDDKALACSTCAIIDHRKCIDVSEIENITKDDQCDTLRGKLQTAITTTNLAIENLKKAKSCLSNDVQIVPDKLSKMRTDIIQMFDDFAAKVTKDANLYRDKTTAEWSKRKLECETNTQSMKCSLETIDIIATKGTPSQQFITARSMTETIQNEVKNADALWDNLKVLNISCNFGEQFDTLRSSLISAIKPDEFEMKYSVPKITKLEPIASIDLKQTGDDVGEPFYTGLDFLPDGRLVVVDNKNDKCLICDENLNPKYEYNLQYQKPVDVAVVSDDEFAITSGYNYRIDFLRVSNSNEITLNRKCKVNVPYFSISMKDDENFVVSSYKHSASIGILSTSGEEKIFDSVFPSKEYPGDISYCTYIRGQDKLVLTDRNADTVYIYDVKTGEKVVIKDELIKAPCGVAIGPYDHVFVCSRSTRSLVEITPAGRVLSSHQVDMKSPRYLTVSKDRRRLAVSNAAVGSHFVEFTDMRCRNSSTIKPSTKKVYTSSAYWDYRVSPLKALRTTQPVYTREDLDKIA